MFLMIVPNRLTTLRQTMKLHKLWYPCADFNQLLSRLTFITFKLHIEITCVSRLQMLNRQGILLPPHMISCC